MENPYSEPQRFAKGAAPTTGKYLNLCNAKLPFEDYFLI